MRRLKVATLLSFTSKKKKKKKTKTKTVARPVTTMYRKLGFFKHIW